MTKLTKPVVRECRLTVFDRGHQPIIISIEPPGLIGLRLKGRSRKFLLNAEDLFWQCLKQEAGKTPKEVPKK